MASGAYHFMLWKTERGKNEKIIKHDVFYVNGYRAYFDDSKR
jgi:hypothetical protein